MYETRQRTRALGSLKRCSAVRGAFYILLKARQRDIVRHAELSFKKNILSLMNQKGTQPTEFFSCGRWVMLYHHHPTVIAIWATGQIMIY